MELICGTSRAGPLVSILEDDSQDYRASYYQMPEISSIKGEVYPGATIDQVTTGAINLMEELSVDIQGPVIAYMICGMPDTTERVVDYYRGRRYEEVITTEPSHTTTQRVIAEIDNSAHRLRQAGAIPVFATIAPIRITTG